MAKTSSVNAWFLDGFAPACNPDIWEEQVLNHIVRLSGIGTTFSSFSVAGVLKRGLTQHGISISRPRGYKHKREMLKAIWLSAEPENTSDAVDTQSVLNQNQPDQVAYTFKQRQIAIIGAGIAGLSSAWAFAERGHQVTLYDQSEPLAGGSGNPLALLNPKLCPIEQSHEHLMTLAWQHALQHYPKFQAFRPIQVHQLALKKAEDLLDLEQQYPAGLLTAETAANSALITEYPSLNLTEAGAVSPHQLKDQILAHPLIQFVQAKITQIHPEHNELFNEQAQSLGQFDHVIVCCARHTATFFEHYPVLKPIRGQVSWVENTAQPLALNQAYSYGGYCMQLDAQQLILGASFYPNRDDSDVLLEDHVHNYELIHSIFPHYAQSLPDVTTWQGRASVRAQSLDYFPVLGKMSEQTEIYSFAGLGSKGFLFAPLCSEILAAQILKEACPVPESLLQKLSPTRFQKKLKAKKPYFKAQS